MTFILHFSHGFGIFPQMEPGNQNLQFYEALAVERVAFSDAQGSVHCHVVFGIQLLTLFVKELPTEYLEEWQDHIVWEVLEWCWAVLSLLQETVLYKVQNFTVRWSIKFNIVQKVFESTLWQLLQVQFDIIVWGQGFLVVGPGTVEVELSQVAREVQRWGRNQLELLLGATNA